MSISNISNNQNYSNFDMRTKTLNVQELTVTDTLNFDGTLNIPEIDTLNNEVQQLQQGQGFTANIDMKGLYKVTNAVDPTQPSDYCTKNYVDTQIDAVETGTISLLFNQPNQIIYGSTNHSPSFPTKYVGTQGFLTDAQVDNSANIQQSKIQNLTSNLSTINTNITNLQNDFPITDSLVSTTANIQQSKILNLTSNLSTINSSLSTLNTNVTNLQNNFPIVDSSVSTTANIQQSKIQNLVSNLSSINGSITSLLSYFTASRLNLANLNKSSTNYQVLSQDLSTNDPAYRQIDSNYISSLNQSKINQNVNNQYVNYCDSTNYPNITTFVNSLTSGSCGSVYPYNNIGGNYTINNNDTWTSINTDLIAAINKGSQSQTVIIGTTTQTLNIGNATNIYGIYMIGFLFNPTINLNIFLNGYIANCQFTKPINIILSQTTTPSKTFLIFENCIFMDIVTFTSNPLTSTIYFNSCNFMSKNFVLTSNVGNVFIANCSNLNNLNYNPITTKIYLAGGNADYLGNSQINYTNPGFYLSSTNQKYLYTNADIAGLNTSKLTADGNLSMGSYLISTTASTFTAPNLITKAYADASYDALNSSVNTSRLNANSGITMGTNLITCTATNTSIGSSSTNLITKSYADATYATGSGFASLTNDQTFTGYNQFNNSSFRIYNTLNNLQFYINSGSYDNIKMTNTIGDNVILGYDLNIAYWRYYTTRWGDQYSNYPFNLIIGNSRATSYLDLPLPVSVCDNTPGLILIGSGNNRNTVSGNNIVIGGNGSASYIQIGGYGGTNQGQIVIGSTYCSGFFQIVKNGNTFGFSNSSASSYITPGSSVITTSSSLDYKLNIINKTDTYITNATTPIKNYLQKIIQMPIYTYTYKKYSMDPLTNPNGSYSEEPSDDDTIYQSTSFEYWYANFSHGIGTWVPTLTEGTKPDPSTFQKLKTIGTGELCNYLVLALQEQDKFIIQPLKQKCTDLETNLNDLKIKFNSLVNFLKVNNVVIGDFNV